MVIRVTKDLIDKAALVDDDKFAVSDSEDLAIPADPESGELKRFSWGALKDLFLNNTVTFVVTTAFLSGEIIDITNGTGATAGVTTRTIGDTGDVTSLGISAAVFNSNASFRVTDNKSIALKDNDVVWDSATTFHFTRALAIGEWFIIEDGTTSGGGTIGNTTIEGTLDVTGDTTIDGCLIQTDSSLVRVTSLACLPAAVGGIIPLLGKTQYRFEADINIGTDRFSVLDGTVVKGLGLNSVVLTYTGTNSLFTGGGVDFSTEQIVVDTPNGNVFNLSGGVTNDGISNHRELRILNCVEVGTFDNIRSVQFFNSSFVNITGTKGLTLAQGALIFSISELFMQSPTTGITFIDLGSSVISNLELNNLIFVSNGASAFGISGLVSSGNVVAGTIATVERSNFSGNITPLENILVEDIRWDFQSNSANVEDTIEYGEMYIPVAVTVDNGTGNSATSFIVDDANTGGTDIWSEIETSKFSVNRSLGRLIHDGERTRFFTVEITATVEKSGGGSDVLIGYIHVNGVRLEHSAGQTQNTSPTSITCQAGVRLVEGDYIGFGVRNSTGDSNVIVNISNVTIK